MIEFGKKDVPRAAMADAMRSDSGMTAGAMATLAQSAPAPTPITTPPSAAAP